LPAKPGWTIIRALCKYGVKGRGDVARKKDAAASNGATIDLGSPADRAEDMLGRVYEGGRAEKVLAVRRKLHNLNWDYAQDRGARACVQGRS